MIYYNSDTNTLTVFLIKPYMTVKVPVGMATSFEGSINSLTLGIASTKDYIEIQNYT